MCWAVWVRSLSMDFFGLGYIMHIPEDFLALPYKDFPVALYAVFGQYYKIR